MSGGLPQVVVLAGGLGTRLGTLGRHCPKVLQTVAGRPFIDFMLEPLVEQGFHRYLFCLGHLAEQVVEHMTERHEQLELSFHVDHEPRGTGGALVASRDLLDERFLVVLGDTYLDTTYSALFAPALDGALAVMAVTDAVAGVPGNVVLEDGSVVAYDKALGPRTRWVDTGALALHRRGLDLVADQPGQMDLGSLFRALLERRALRACTTGARFYDIGTPQRLDEFAAFVTTRAGLR